MEEFVIKPYDTWTDDEILDRYNETGEKLILSYLFIKKNNLKALDIKDMFDNFEQSFLYIYNLQCVMEGKEEKEKFSYIKDITDDDIYYDDEDYDF